MTAKMFRLVLTGAAGALLLAGCASTPPEPSTPQVQPGPAVPVASSSAIDCQAFTERMAAHAAVQADSTVTEPDVLAASDIPATDAEAGDDGEPVDASPTTLAALPLFSVSPRGNRLPVGWQPWTINRNKIPTTYSMAEVDQRVVVHAKADSSASGLYVPLRERDAGMLRWTWKTSGIIRNADNSHGAREDSPLRLFVAFDGDKGALPLKDQLMYEMARLTTGREMPYATLMYIWGGQRAEGAVVKNPHTDRVRMIVVDSGTKHANKWRCHERDLRADYRKAFGTDPGQVIAVGIMTDTDNTKSKAEAWYGDIALD
ncbi:DUF3047 domain-containing protein [Cupriavidus taiwanensis]|uniref:DUF3047 domain-containing protein n=1 Tax=Cupriavidus taiwanensis TaxID=164546 RepID=UPI000E103032|nr:DUF3047 domain-containing protein [Cupriavidus taiwanensis]SOY51408.1 conserved hypothetical protein; putative exported protein; putative lipoprotein [Cupriavidus taiwanensis]SOY51472.1 conserved hypothetical protein; putative exported protein; putative lipoprotein [Cupriavidus taiwanensis]SOY84046.1 conserved hypothetical protein; putative exported protein; putative lipoprotein [Cupriavidus taiwanensis]SOZ58379.1 conserved hypothetical protein; putative exported protein; putative lipoprotei